LESTECEDFTSLTRSGWNSAGSTNGDPDFIVLLGRVVPGKSVLKEGCSVKKKRGDFDSFRIFTISAVDVALAADALAGAGVVGFSFFSEADFFED